MTWFDCNEGDESDSKIEFRMSSKQIYDSKLSTNCFSTDGYVNNVTYCNFSTHPLTLNNLKSSFSSQNDWTKTMKLSRETQNAVKTDLPKQTFDRLVEMGKV